VNKSEQNCFPKFSKFLKTDLFLNIPSIDEQLFFDLFFPVKKWKKPRSEDIQQQSWIVIDQKEPSRGLITSV
jgi:hypothetical protein